MGDLTRAQRKWLAILRQDGFVEAGGWGRGQRNRPLNVLVELGFARFGWGPEGSFLQMQGYLLNEIGGTGDG